MIFLCSSAFAGSQHSTIQQDAWQKSQPEKRAHSGNPKLSWRTRATNVEKPAVENDGVATSDEQARSSAEGDPKDAQKVSTSTGKASAAVARVDRKVVPATHRQKLKLKPAAAERHVDEAVEPAGAPVLRSALQPRPGRRAEELPADPADDEPSEDVPSLEEGPDMTPEVEEPRTLDETDDPSPLRDPTDDDLFLPNRPRRQLDRLEPEEMPEHDQTARSSASEECARECPPRTDPRMFRNLSEISLDLTDPRRTIADAPSDYLDEQGRGPDHIDFENGEKFIPRRSFRRCWTDAAGSQFIGWYVKFEKDRVLVIDEDRKEHWIPKNQLTLRDVRYLYHLPGECVIDADPFIPRQWCQTTFTWKASCLCHKPLYFEQVNFERYGHTWGPLMDPVLSGAHFFTSFVFLPYKMGIEPPQECIYPLGYYRPNSCAPYMLFPIPLSWRGALFEAGAVTGVIWMLNP